MVCVKVFVKEAVSTTDLGKIASVFKYLNCPRGAREFWVDTKNAFPNTVELCANKIAINSIPPTMNKNI